MSIPLDVSACGGNGSPVCADCARRIVDSKAVLRWWIHPVAAGDVCEMKPIPYELTDKGRELLDGK